MNKTDKLGNAADYMKSAEVYAKQITPAAVVPVSAAEKRGLEEACVGDKRRASRAARDLSGRHADGFDGALSSPPRSYARRFSATTDEEVPHGVAVVIDEFKSPDEYPELKVCTIRATIVVDRPGQKGIIIGKNGAMLKQIGSEARAELEEMFGYKVFLQLWVKVRPGWRKSPEELRRLGYGA